MAQVKTKQDFQNEMKALEAKHNAKRKDPKFRVVPGLSLTSRDIQKRVHNRSLRGDTSGNQYSLDLEVDATRRMSKLDIRHKMKENLQKQQDLRNDLLTKQKQQDEFNRNRAAGASGKEGGTGTGTTGNNT